MNSYSEEEKKLLTNNIFDNSSIVLEEKEGELEEEDENRWYESILNKIRCIVYLKRRNSKCFTLYDSDCYLTLLRSNLLNSSKTSGTFPKIFVNESAPFSFDRRRCELLKKEHDHYATIVFNSESNADYGSTLHQHVLTEESNGLLFCLSQCIAFNNRNRSNKLPPKNKSNSNIATNSQQCQMKKVGSKETIKIPGKSKMSEKSKFLLMTEQKSKICPTTSPLSTNLTISTRTTTPASFNSLCENKMENNLEVEKKKNSSFTNSSTFTTMGKESIDERTSELNSIFPTLHRRNQLKKLETLHRQKKLLQEQDEHHQQQQQRRQILWDDIERNDDSIISINSDGNRIFNLNCNNSSNILQQQQQQFSSTIIPPSFTTSSTTDLNLPTSTTTTTTTTSTSENSEEIFPHQLTSTSTDLITEISKNCHCCLRIDSEKNNEIWLFWKKDACRLCLDIVPKLYSNQTYSGTNTSLASWRRVWMRQCGSTTKLEVTSKIRTMGYRIGFIFLLKCSPRYRTKYEQFILTNLPLIENIMMEYRNKLIQLVPSIYRVSYEELDQFTSLTNLHANGSSKEQIEILLDETKRFFCIEIYFTSQFRYLLMARPLIYPFWLCELNPLSVKFNYQSMFIKILLNLHYSFNSSPNNFLLSKSLSVLLLLHRTWQETTNLFNNYPVEYDDPEKNRYPLSCLQYCQLYSLFSGYPRRSVRLTIVGDDIEKVNQFIYFFSYFIRCQSSNPSSDGKASYQMSYSPASKPSEECVNINPQSITSESDNETLLLEEQNLRFNGINLKNNRKIIFVDMDELTTNVIEPKSNENEMTTSDDSDIEMKLFDSSNIETETITMNDGNDNDNDDIVIDDDNLKKKEKIISHPLIVSCHEELKMYLFDFVLQGVRFKRDELAKDQQIDERYIEALNCLPREKQKEILFQAIASRVYRLSAFNNNSIKDEDSLDNYQMNTMKNGYSNLSKLMENTLTLCIIVDIDTKDVQIICEKNGADKCRQLLKHQQSYENQLTELFHQIYLLSQLNVSSQFILNYFERRLHEFSVQFDLDSFNKKTILSDSKFGEEVEKFLFESSESNESMVVE
ncbi:hypothetical protein SNEBB_002722 [Seison nebaliae]|nr:hypothetical protein SNEBB_002722 [Seison nebaliae]